jgi:hypothetical protein
MATSKAYLSLAQAIFNKEVDFDSDTVKVALLSSGYTPDQNAHDYFNDVSAYEVTGTGYTAGGQALAGKTVTKDTANKVVVFDANDVTWANSTITARYAVVYDDSGATTATKALIGYIDLVSDQASNNGNFVIQWDATGILRLSVA